jgi:hypothetical protein
VTAMRTLVAALRDPASVAALDGAGWTALVSVARAEALLATLAHRVEGQPVPPAVEPTLSAARRDAAQAQVAALWEAEMARRALVPLGIESILLKGTAYAAAGLPNAAGRQIGDLDILVPRDRVDAVEAALLDAGWEWVKDDPYDQSYYRRWMHELPPLIHKSRDRMIDVHHTILPLTARVRPDAAVLIAEAKPLPSKGGDGVGKSEGDPPSPTPDPSLGREGGVRTLSPTGMILHAAAHLMADGELDGGLRNLWDIDRLVRHFCEQIPEFLLDVMEDAAFHQLTEPVLRSLRLARQMFGTPIPEYRTPLILSTQPVRSDRLFLRRLLARDDWGKPTRPLTHLAFTIRGHWMRMPPLMLARHLWTKWRKR